MLCVIIVLACFILAAAILRRASTVSGSRPGIETSHIDLPERAKIKSQGL